MYYLYIRFIYFISINNFDNICSLSLLYQFTVIYLIFFSLLLLLALTYLRVIFEWWALFKTSIFYVLVSGVVHSWILNYCFYWRKFVFKISWELFFLYYRNKIFLRTFWKIFFRFFEETGWRNNTTFYWFISQNWLNHKFRN